MRIVLMRHGKPNVEFKRWIYLDEVDHWIKRYNQVGIDKNQQKVSVKNINYVITSNLPRAVESARYFGLHIDTQESLLREAELEGFPMKVMKLPPVVWIGLLRVLWILGIKPQSIESFNEAVCRAESAAWRVEELAQKYYDVLIVGHGFFNRLMIYKLQRIGWKKMKKVGKGFFAYYEMKKI